MSETATTAAMRVTPGGVSGIKRLFIVFAVGFLAATGAAANSFLLCYMAAMLLLLPAVSFLMGRRAVRGIRVTRTAPESVWTGDAVEITLSVQGGSGMLYPLLRVRDELPTALQPDGDLEAQVTAGADGARATYSALVRRRGVHRFDRAVAMASDPLGVVDFHLSLPAETLIVAYPRPEPIQWLSLPGAERYGAVDMARATARGAGVDPDGARPYEPGDPLRRMHWRATARTGVLNVKEFEEARSLSALLVLDCWSGVPGGEAEDGPFEVMVRAAASLASMWLASGAAVGLACGLELGPAFGVARGSAHLLAQLDALAHAAPKDPRRLADALPAVAGLTHPGVTLVALTADPSPDLVRTCTQLASAGVGLQMIYATTGAALAAAPAAWLGSVTEAPPLVVSSGPGLPLQLQGVGGVLRAA
ncbi:MAG: DUF58 domain-containing protein [Armatimonadetes bacterium]|nr:DUF58 domain-containing protein [Armatimonadota bacterium]